MRLKTILRTVFCLPGLWAALLAVPSFALVALALLWGWTGAPALAAVNLIRFRRYGSPLLSAAKAINMTAALVSMLSLEAAMLDRFGGNDPDLFRETMLGVTGVAVYAAVLAISVFMLVRSGRALKQSS